MIAGLFEQLVPVDYFGFWVKMMLVYLLRVRIFQIRAVLMGTAAIFDFFRYNFMCFFAILCHIFQYSISFVKKKILK